MKKTQGAGFICVVGIIGVVGYVLPALEVVKWRYKKLIIPFMIAAFVIAADQISKYIVKTNMNLYDSFTFIRHILDIRYIENEGASLGMLKDHRWIFMSLSTVALVLMGAAIFYLGKKSFGKKNMIINIALAFMFGGGAGNMIDRFLNYSVVKDGVKVVVDFLEFPFFRFFTFNVADAFISIGSVLFCVCMFMGKYKLKDSGESGEITEIDEISEISETQDSENTGDDVL